MLRPCYKCNGKGWLDDRQTAFHYDPEDYDNSYGNRKKAWCGTISTPNMIVKGKQDAYHIGGGWTMDYTSNKELVSCRRCLRKLNLPVPEKKTCDLCEGEGFFNEYYPDPISNPYLGSLRSELKAARKNGDRKKGRMLEEKGEEITGIYRESKSIPITDNVIPCRRCGDLFESHDEWRNHCEYICKTRTTNPYFPKNEKIIIKGFNIIKESEKAILIKQNDISDWIPRSQITIDPIKNQIGMPTWLWEKKRFA